MKHLLFIVTESRSANGICTKAVMRACVARGYSVHCITNRERDDQKGRDPKTVDGVTYETVKPRWQYRLQAQVAALPVGSIRRRLMQLVHNVVNKAKLFLSLPTWPWISPSYTCRIYKKAVSVCQRYPVDAVIPVYTQIDTLIAAHRLKKRYPSMAYVPYFLDALSAGYGPKMFSCAWVERRGLAWERRLLPRADRILMMESAKPHYERLKNELSYYDRMTFLSLPLFDPTLGESPSAASVREEDVIRLVFVGSIPAHIRDPHYFIELFHQLPDARLRLTLMGSSTCEGYLRDAASRDARITLLPAADHETALRVMREADVLLNLGNNNARMTPSKIFEYMSMGKPIVSTAPIADEPSIRYLDEYPCKYIVEEWRSPQAHIAPLLSFLDDNRLYRIDPQTLADAFYSYTPAAFLACLDEILQEKHV